MCTFDRKNTDLRQALHSRAASKEVSMVAHHTEDGKISKNTNNRETSRFQNPGIAKIARAPPILFGMTSPPFG